MAEHDKHSSGVDAVTNMQPSQGRRRLVKGALLATPAVMTLMSGRLAAATSMTCALKAGTPGEGWVDENLNPLVFGTDSNGSQVLGYYSDTGQRDSNGQPILEFIPSAPAAPSASCLTSLRP